MVGQNGLKEIVCLPRKIEVETEEDRLCQKFNFIIQIRQYLNDSGTSLKSDYLLT